MVNAVVLGECDLQFNEADRFAVLAIENVYVDGHLAQSHLSDGTWALTRSPIVLESHWKEWVGTVRFGKIQSANVFLVQAEAASVPEEIGQQERDLASRLNGFFCLLQLAGVLEYDGAILISGSQRNGQAQANSLGELEGFRPTRGDVRKALTTGRLDLAATLRINHGKILVRTPDFERFVRGLNILVKGLQEKDGQERLHRFVRSLEALILPRIGKTKKDFVDRCQTFTGRSSNAASVLEEIFEMRSDTEHLHKWDRSLQRYPENDREHVALQRVRQVERLASFAYSRILANDAVQDCFRNESSIEAFWTGQNENQRRVMWGGSFNLSDVLIVRRYDQFGRGLDG